MVLFTAYYSVDITFADHVIRENCKGQHIKTHGIELEGQEEEAAHDE